LSELRACIRFHKKDIPELPEFPKIQVQEKPINWLTEQEQDRIFQFIPKKDLPIFEFMRRFGCRENEAAGLLRRSLFLDHNSPYVILETVLGACGKLKPTTKTKRIKVLPIPYDLLWIFKPTEATQFVFSRNGKPYYNRILSNIWNRANRESGVKKCNLYNAMRHSFGMQRLNQGFSLDEVRAVMGHTDSRTTQRYARYLPETLVNVIEGRGYKKVISLSPENQTVSPNKASLQSFGMRS
jgi:integrase